MKRKGRKSAAQTPAPPKEQIYGSKKNPKGSAASKSAASKIELSTKALEALKNKRAKFKEKYPSKDVSLNTLKAVMRRGMGAYSTSFRPTITGGKPNSRQAWGFARVNKFLEKKAGKPVKKAYVQDDDLLEKGGELKLLAPNGKPSNLTPEQYRLVRTPEFKAWFGDWENDPKNASKVVDENGEPKVVWHGSKKWGLDGVFQNISRNTTTTKIDELGIHFGTLSQAQFVLNEEYVPKSTIISLKPFFLNVRNLKRVYDSNSWDINSFKQHYERLGLTQNKKFENINDVHQDLKSKKIDGFIYFNRFEGDDDSYIVFEPNQIKLADGTNTTFDANNPDIRYEDGGFLQSIYEGMDNLIKNGIVLTDKSKNIIVIAYNTGNQERDKSLYNKALIYYSVKPLRQANEIIENFDNEEYSLFDVKKIEEYKNAPHLIILNQNEVVYDSNNPNIRYKEGGNTKQMFIHWTDRGGLKNILSENILFEETSLTDSLKLPFDIDNNLPFGIVFKDNIYKELYKIDEEQAGTPLEIEHEYRTKNKIIFDIYFDGFVVRNQKNRKSLESYLENSQDFWQNDNLRKYYKEKGYNIRKAESPNKYHLGGDMSKHLAPNGNPSNLTHEQWHLVRTPEFKAWFGDWENDPENASKVVDENGEPLVVNHTYETENPPNIFEKSKEVYVDGKYKRVFESDEIYQKLKGIYGREIIDGVKYDVISDYWEFWFTNKIFGGGIDAKYISCFLNIRNLIIDENGKSGQGSFGNSKTDYDGISGLKIENPDGQVGVDYYIVLFSNQIKLADGTNTAFDHNNPDIRYKRGGKMKDSIALPDSYATYDKLKPILENQGYMLEKIIKPTKSIEQIAKDFSLPTSLLHKQLEIGKQHELEHTYSIELAEKTALHHLAENPFYYTHLKEMEMKVEAEKLEGYYRMGGALEGEFTCEVLDEEGERMIDPASIESLTECISNLPQTKSMHFDYEKNDYKPYRKRLHKDIIYEFKKDLVCIENAEPIAILMGGSPASGKSTFLKKFAPYLLKEDIFKIDADEIRSKLPEYRGYNASQTHLETKDIVTTLLSDRNIGLPCKFDVIYDGTMNNTKSYVPLIDLLKSLGYKVFIVYIDKVPKDVVIKRSLERYKKQGRFVPLEVIEDFFSKGKEALNELKKQVDGYMVIDGSDTEYRVMERGGKRIPRDRNYNKLGEPIKITSEEVIREFKKGGEIDPNDPAIKEAMTHKAGAAGGLLVGNRHSEGGIKAVNKSNGQPLEMEGGEVVITRNAVSDETKREFEGEMLTNREILSRINQSGGGVSFAEGGDIPEKCACSGKTYNYGGKVRSDYDIVKEINTPSLEETAMEMYAKGGMLSIPSPFGQGTLKIPTLDSFIKRGKPLESNGIAYIPKYNKVLGEVVYYRDGDKRSKKMSSFDAYRFYLMQQFNVQFEKLNNAIKTTLIK